MLRPSVYPEALRQLFIKHQLIQAEDSVASLLNKNIEIYLDLLDTKSNDLLSYKECESSFIDRTGNFVEKYNEYVLRYSGLSLLIRSICCNAYAKKSPDSEEIDQDETKDQLKVSIFIDRDYCPIPNVWCLSFVDDSLCMTLATDDEIYDPFYAESEADVAKFITVKLKRYHVV